MGFDVDWGVSGDSAAETKNRVEDKRNFTLLMKALREQMNTWDGRKRSPLLRQDGEPYYDHILR